MSHLVAIATAIIQGKLMSMLRHDLHSGAKAFAQKLHSCCPLLQQQLLLNAVDLGCVLLLLCSAAVRTARASPAAALDVTCNNRFGPIGTGGHA